MLLSAAMKQANSIDGEKVAAALENLNGVQGVITRPTTNPSPRPCTRACVDDFYLARWKGGEVVRFQDDLYRSITPADLKK
jgi:branched-chain amino acid transport system substrate-binding protein